MEKYALIALLQEEWAPSMRDGAASTGRIWTEGTRGLTPHEKVGIHRSR